MFIADKRLGYMPRGHNPLGVVIHNDEGVDASTTQAYDNYLSTKDLTSGYAHYYVCSDGTLQVADESSIAWHSGNQWGNANLIGIEACQSNGNLEQFKKNEENALKLAAQIFMRYGIQPNRNTVILHKALSATACPSRSIQLHGDWTAVQDYFIERIKYHMGQATSKPSYKPSKPKTAIEQFKSANHQYTAYGDIRVDEIKHVNGMWQFVNYKLAGSKNVNWTYNGIPLAYVDNISRGNQLPTKVGDRVRLAKAYNHGTIDMYDPKSNGVGISMGTVGIIWFNADALIAL
ncbi:N-acetylmuramoyl-L-alanine amidase [Weissella ceti]|uniref:N-acetylmuramoyl-L-alanine amidase n=1 Tax=Weissella ceti TaxID=759620 RepID=A0ABT3E3L0_9LACO|nr:N-acetylmuramoyl-L-alanine amidase [Weissella ceti]MCW0952991.1 N-acetylmuramoyl-L-alanine amidase [Weissella ceti]QVK11537.1 N-acetylmuramoyl-L-alanine amidase [Weissella ceti]